MISLGDVFIGNYPVTQRFGENFKLANGTWAYKNGHMGWDFGTPNGTPIVAPTDGEIIRSGNYNDGYGNCIQILNIPERFAVKVGHLQTCLVGVGQRVWQGQLIGYSDNTGFSTGAHLHVEACEVDANGYRINRNNGHDGLVDLAGKWMEVRNLKTPVSAPVAPPPPVPTPTPQPVPQTPPTPPLAPTEPFKDETTPATKPPVHVEDNTVKPPEPSKDPTIPQGILFWVNLLERIIKSLLERR